MRTRTHLRLRKEIKKALYDGLMVLSLISFIYCGFYKQLYFIGFINLVFSFYFNVKSELIYK